MAELTHVDQAVLVHTQINERAKGSHVAHRAFEHHALFQILDVFHAVVETRHLETGARVTAGLFKLAQDVFHGDDAERLVGKQLRAQGFEHVSAAHQLGHWLGGVCHDFFDHRIGLGVHAGHVQRVATAANSQKPCALLESFGTQTGHLQKLLAVVERAVGLAPAHHRLGHAARQARDPAEQRHAGSVEVHPNRVHAVFHHGFQAFDQIALVHVVLVLAHADGFGVDLDQFGQRVLQPPGDAGRAAQAHIHVGHLL